MTTAECEAPVPHKARKRGIHARLDEKCELMLDDLCESRSPALRPSGMIRELIAKAHADLARSRAKAAREASLSARRAALTLAKRKSIRQLVVKYRMPGERSWQLSEPCASYESAQAICAKLPADAEREIRPFGE